MSYTQHTAYGTKHALYRTWVFQSGIEETVTGRPVAARWVCGTCGALAATFGTRESPIPCLCTWATAQAQQRGG